MAHHQRALNSAIFFDVKLIKIKIKILSRKRENGS